MEKKKKRKPKVQVYLKGSDIKWWFSLMPNNYSLVSLETYTRKANARRAAERVCEALGAEPEWM